MPCPDLEDYYAGNRNILFLLSLRVNRFAAGTRGPPRGTLAESGVDRWHGDSHYRKNTKPVKPLRTERGELYSLELSSRSPTRQSRTQTDSTRKTLLLLTKCLIQFLYMYATLSVIMYSTPSLFACVCVEWHDFEATLCGGGSLPLNACLLLCKHD